MDKQALRNVHMELVEKHGPNVVTLARNLADMQAGGDWSVNVDNVRFTNNYINIAKRLLTNRGDIFNGNPHVGVMLDTVPTLIMLTP